MAGRRYWLMKCEPEAYTIERLEHDGTTSWEGVRNFQARNFMREMQVGDLALFYASNAKPSGPAGVVRIAHAAYPDPVQFQKGHEYYEPKARPEKPYWYTVDVAFVERFPQVVSLETLKATAGLRKMMVVQPGRRPSVQPVEDKDFQLVCRLGRKGEA
jgi:predicted RNA-binding protein with PUA-like domain